MLADALARRLLRGPEKHIKVVMQIDCDTGNITSNMSKKAVVGLDLAAQLQFKNVTKRHLEKSRNTLLASLVIFVENHSITL